ncbi:ATP-binding protein [Candidatus Bathyarchaeota archaeon]|nr:ATP-binding protein [Candidatus Bathyarchaeota archaeon]
MEVVGSVIAGSHGNIIIRQKSGSTIELGELLRVDHEDGGYSILQVNNLKFASQIQDKQLEMISGMKLEGYSSDLEFMEPNLRNYLIATVKAVLTLKNKKQKIPKILPPFFGSVNTITDNDLAFLTKPDNPVFVGNVRSGSRVLKMKVYLNGEDMFKHHVLIPATTGRGKSNLVKVMLWSTIANNKFGVLVLDPHDEYYGRHGVGLKDHPLADANVVYYSPNAPPGANTLLINLGSIKPSNLTSLISFTNAQKEALTFYYNIFRANWIENIIRGTAIENSGIGGITLQVIQRKLNNVLGVFIRNGDLVCRNQIFSSTAGETTISDIVKSLESGKTVIIDTSRLLTQAELLIGSMIAGKIFWLYQQYKSKGILEDKPIVSVVIEEAPRVLGSERLQSGDNIYSTIAKEGRKFRIGLIAITQLTSVIPKEILANLNTKIILGNEMVTERRAVMESACQDLSSDDQAISSLDIGEAIVSSTFTKFAVPVNFPKFEDIVETETRKKASEKIIFK